MSIRVDKDALSICDGNTHYPAEKRTHRFFKGALDLPPRIVVVDGSGEISFDAIDWLTAQGIALIRLSWDGKNASIMSPNGYAADPKKVAWQRETRGDPEKRWAFSLNIVARKLDATIETLREHVPSSRYSEGAEREIIAQMERIANDPPPTVSELLGVEGPARLRSKNRER